MDLERKICAILRRHFGCGCSRPPYCQTVSELANLIEEACEEEAEEGWPNK